MNSLVFCSGFVFSISSLSQLSVFYSVLTIILLLTVKLPPNPWVLLNGRLINFFIGMLSSLNFNNFASAFFQG